jgi:hypothetical protein
MRPSPNPNTAKNKNTNRNKNKPKLGTSGSCLPAQLCRMLTSGGYRFQVSPGKVCETPYPAISRGKTGHSGTYLLICHPNYSMKCKISQFKSTWAEKWDPISKITRAKKAGGMAQVVEWLPRNFKPWVQTPVPHTHTHTQRINKKVKFSTVKKYFNKKK